MNVNHFILAVWALSYREVLRFVRQRSRWVGALATPLLFWLLIGGGLGNSFQDMSGQSSNGYLGYFYPGSLALTVLFTAIFSTISVIEDRHQGFLQGVLVSPIPRSSFVLAKILGGAILGTMQGLLLLLFAPIAGITLSVGAVFQVTGFLFLMAATLTALAFIFAWIIDSVQGFHGIMNLILMPMWILSGAVFPSRDNLFFKIVDKINPLTYGISALRRIFSGAYARGEAGLFVPAVALAGFFVFFFVASTLVIDRPSKR